MNPKENVCNIMTKEIGNQVLCKKDVIWMRLCMHRAWNSITPNVLEELYNSMSRRNADLIKAKRGSTKTDFMM